jgi:hypothetical protein
MPINLESRLASGTILSGVASPERSAPASRSNFLALSALVSEREIAPTQTRGAVRSADKNAIKAISVVGAERLEATTVLSYVQLRCGRVYSPDAIDNAIRELVATELFADVQIRNDDGELTIRVRENPVINRIVFEGNKRIKEDKLFRELKLAPRQVLTRSNVRTDVARILDLYRRQGRFAARIEPKMVALDLNRVDIIFEISEGRKFKGRQINFIDKEAFASGEVAAKTTSIKRSKGGIKSLGYFQENLEIIQRQGSESDRIVLEANVVGSPSNELELSAGYSSFELFILNASIQYRKKGQELKALIDVSDQVGVHESTSASDETDENLSAADLCTSIPTSSVPNSSIIATKVGIDTFLDRKFVELQAVTGDSEESNFGEEGHVNYGNSVADLINIDYPLSFEKILLSLIYQNGVCNELQNIIAAERCLKFDDDSTRRNVLARSLEVPLEPVFDEAGYPEALRPIFIGRIIDEILSYGVAGREPWAARVVKNVSVKPLSKQSQPPLPETPPALWKESKEPGDTPPEFIRRHYGPWLNVDATGLTRPDIKRLDPSLYMALANWLRKNELPDDCPVPIKSQRLDSELARVAEGGLASVVSGDDPASILRDAQRLLSAKRRRER